MVHSRLKPYCYFASFNLLTLFLFTLSVIDIFLPFEIFLLTKTLGLSAYRANFTIMGLDFRLPLSFLKLPILCVRSICSIFISIFISDFKVFITNSSKSLSLFPLMPWIKKQFLRDYCACLSSFTSKFSKLLWRSETWPRNNLMTSSFYHI